MGGGKSLTVNDVVPGTLANFGAIDISPHPIFILVEFGFGGFERGVVAVDVVAVGGCDAVDDFVGQRVEKLR